MHIKLSDLRTIIGYAGKNIGMAKPRLNGMTRELEHGEFVALSYLMAVDAFLCKNGLLDSSDLVFDFVEQDSFPQEDDYE